MARALTIEDLFKIERISQLLVSHDGKSAWLVTRRFQLRENTSRFHTYAVDLRTNAVKEIVLHEKGAHDLALLHNGKSLCFAADGQLWLANTDGSGLRQITRGAGGASCPVVAHDDSKILFTRSVYTNPETQKIAETDNPTMAQIYGLAHPKATARTADRLLYRHWDEWTENKRKHLFIVDIPSQNMADLTPEDADIPPIALESRCDYAFSPDDTLVAFVKNPDKVVARSTNNSVYLARLNGLALENVQRISDTDGCDTAPQFLDNNRIAYCSMLTPGYESDATRLKIYDIQNRATQCLLCGFERSVDKWVPLNGNQILFSAQDFAHISLYRLNLDSRKIEQITSGKTYVDFAATPDSAQILAITESLARPAELVSLSSLTPFAPQLDCAKETRSHETVCQISRFGDVLSGIEMHEGVPLRFNYQNFTLEGYIVTPPGFDPEKKYPLILLIHGGPQGAFLDQFHYRWSTQMFASQGAVVAFCNPHGSTGYGHALTRAISQHWSDECPGAIMKFVDCVLERMPQVDPNRMAAAGASFGGFMINWLLGHTDRFKALVSHDGIFNTEMSCYITDELWFNEYEFGAKPFDNPDASIRHSPHRFVKNFKTPTLVIQGEQDFRCFISEGVALFTALQYMGVESRLLYFPNEGHWVLDPANAAVWYHEVLQWMMSRIA